MFGHERNHKTKHDLIAELEVARMVHSLRRRVLRGNAPKGFIQRRLFFFSLCGTFLSLAYVELFSPSYHQIRSTRLWLMSPRRSWRNSSTLRINKQHRTCSIIISAMISRLVVKSLSGGYFLPFGAILNPYQCEYYC